MPKRYFDHNHMRLLLRSPQLPAIRQPQPLDSHEQPVNIDYPPEMKPSDSLNLCDSALSSDGIGSKSTEYLHVDAVNLMTAPSILWKSPNIGVLMTPESHSGEINVGQSA